jgi:hypothetical protein
MASVMNMRLMPALAVCNGVRVAIEEDGFIVDRVPILVVAPVALPCHPSLKAHPPAQA